jgi:hypothetical protein
VARGGKQVFSAITRFRRAGGTYAEIGKEAHMVGYILAGPIVREIPAHARGAVVAHSVGYAYDYFSESSASSSSSYQQNGGAGGTRPDMVKPAFGKTSLRKRRGGACPPGYGLQQIKTRWGKKYMCVLPKRERSKKFDAEIL